MKVPKDIPLVTTIKERCRVCYTCVRECPAKAIRIADGQAEVVGARCIGCGNCVRVCSQRAKQVLDATSRVKAALGAKSATAAVLAPSFPAEFEDMDYREMVGMLRALGFDYVHEVAFGADLVAAAYHKLLAEKGEKRYIATSCPGVVAFVERYHPDLISSLAPIVSPMIAIARVLHRVHGDDLKIVFIGPCIAKKGEAASPEVAGEVDAALTFEELRGMFREAGIRPSSVEPSNFDPPHANMGALFSISRGMLQAANIAEDLLTGEVVATDGRADFVDAIKEFESGALDARMLEVLCCSGCIMGAGSSTEAPRFRRQSLVSQYVRERSGLFDLDEWRRQIDRFSNLNLAREYIANDQRIGTPMEREIETILARMGKFTPEDELNCGACGYETCKAHAVAIFKNLAESEMCLPYTIEQLRRTVSDLAVSNEQLASTQEALMQSEKLASMGQLAAGIAHEVNNPLGVVLMYAHLLLDEAEAGSEYSDDLKMIAEQADRCKKIVAGLLHFARQNKVVLEPVNVCEVADGVAETVVVPDNVTLKIEHNIADPRAELDRDQIVQVLTNLMTNAISAMPDGGTLRIETEGDEENVRLIVSDTGTGIPEDIVAKIFEPFFTTKEIGKGTGLGLAVTYGIVKMHRGDIKVTSNTDPAGGPTGTKFTVILPRKGRLESKPEDTVLQGTKQ